MFNHESQRVFTQAFVSKLLALDPTLRALKVDLMTVLGEMLEKKYRMDVYKAERNEVKLHSKRVTKATLKTSVVLSPCTLPTPT
jgi:hypothetical protein